MFYTVPFLLASLATLAQAYTLSNVTISPTNTSFLTYAPCKQQPGALCNGAWWSAQDPLFTFGTGMVAGNPTSAFSYLEPYVSWTFMGSAFYVYELVNFSSAFQLQANRRTRLPNMNLTSRYNLQPNSPTELRLIWAEENLNPLATTTFGLQHYNNYRRNTFIYLDHIVVTQTTLQPGDIIPKPELGFSIGVVRAGLMFCVLGLGLRFFVVWRTQRAAATRKGRRAWQGSASSIPSIQFVDPSSEIEASERIAREGQLEEQQEQEAARIPELLV